MVVETRAATNSTGRNRSSFPRAPADSHEDRGAHSGRDREGHRRGAEVFGLSYNDPWRPAVAAHGELRRGLYLAARGLPVLPRSGAAGTA